MIKLPEPNFLMPTPGFALYFYTADQMRAMYVQGVEDSARVAKAIADNERSDGAARFEPAICALLEKGETK